MERERERDRDREPERERHRDRERQRERGRGRKREREREREREGVRKRERERERERERYLEHSRLRQLSLFRGDHLSIEREERGRELGVLGHLKERCVVMNEVPNQTNNTPFKLLLVVDIGSEYLCRRERE